MHYRCISCEELNTLHTEKAITLVDVRSQESFATAAMPNAIHINYDNFRPFIKATPKTTPIVIYCYHGHASQDLATNVYRFRLPRSLQLRWRL